MVLNEKCVVLLSGGLDSAVLLYQLARDYECYPLTFDYGQTHRREIVAAFEVCLEHSTQTASRFKLADVRGLADLLSSSLTSGVGIPKGRYSKETMSSTFVPNRNMIMIAIAAGYAQSVGAEVVAITAHGGDHFLYPDCTTTFLDSMSETLRVGTDFSLEGVQLLRPFDGMFKSYIVQEGHYFDVPFAKTWSCYEGGSLHCGRCSTCIERRDAFEKANVLDPTVYRSKRRLKGK